MSHKEILVFKIRCLQKFTVMGLGGLEILAQSLRNYKERGVPENRSKAQISMCQRLWVNYVPHTNCRLSKKTPSTRHEEPLFELLVRVVQVLGYCCCLWLPLELKISTYCQRHYYTLQCKEKIQTRANLKTCNLPSREAINGLIKLEHQ